MSIDYSGMAFPKPQKGSKKKKDISTANRIKLKSLFNNRCALCGGEGTHIHHIVYRSEDKSKIDDLENLILLCLNCHQKVHENKKYWQPKLMQIRNSKA